MEHGWAYGHTGTALKGKRMGNVVSAGGSRNLTPVGDIMALPFMSSCCLSGKQPTYAICITCHPSVIHGTHRMENKDLPFCCQSYRRLLENLRDDRFTQAALVEAEYLNDLTTPIEAPKEANQG